MRLESAEERHLTYCTNIHPGETWADVARVLERFVPDVKRRVAPTAPFGVGLRLSGRAAAELEAPATLERARDALDASGLYVFSLNGFPFGAFHGTRVKERVYQPDWLSEARLLYTASLARVLAALLPEGMLGSISTVPGCFAPDGIGATERARIARNLAESAASLVALERDTGKRIVLALEPEPACLLERSDQALALFEGELASAGVLDHFAKLAGLARKEAEATLRRHLGVCLDTCHASVEFEAPRAVLAKLTAAGIEVPKIQLSAGLRLSRPDAEARRALAAFDDEVYLHQTVVKKAEDGTLVRFVDLDRALSEAPALGENAEWRVHYHVPIFERELPPFTSTRDDLADLLANAPSLAPHLEVETYTFGILPARYRTLDVTEAIARELDWALAALGARR